MKVSGYQGCENGGGLGVSDFDQSCWLDGTRNFFHHRINWLGADIDPDQYPQIPSHGLWRGKNKMVWKCVNGGFNVHNHLSSIVHDRDRSGCKWEELVGSDQKSSCQKVGPR